MNKGVQELYAITCITISCCFFQDETTADQHSLLDELTDNQSSMTVKPMDVHPFALVQPEVALTANLQDKSEQRDNSTVLSQEKPLYDQLLVSEHHTKRCNEQQR